MPLAPLLLSLAVLTAVSATAQVEVAIDQATAWLIGEQNANGSFGTVAELSPRDSALAVRALVAEGVNTRSVTEGLVYLAVVPERSTQFRSLRALALARAGRDTNGLLDSLSDFRNGEAFSAFATHESNLFDTALAIQALTVEESARLLEMVALLDYLLPNQGADGGWGFLPGSPSEGYFTAEAAIALAGLESLNVAPSTLAGAAGFLAGRQAPDGSFGSVLETAVVFRALLDLGYDVASLPASPVSWLLAQQAPDGSWDQDTFTTAEVVLALGRVLPNLVVVSVAASAESVGEGENVTLDVTVRNVGPVAAPASFLAIRAGAADSTDERVEEPVPALAPGAEEVLSISVPTTGDEGEVVLFAVADARGEIEETAEDDNAESVRVALRSGADLALFDSDLSASPAMPEPGVDFDLLVGARNQGETAVASFDYRVSRLVGGVPVEVLAEAAAGPAEPGTGSVVAVVLNLAEGEHLLRVELDPGDAVAESDETNNTAELMVQVFDQQLPDFAIDPADLVIVPAQPNPGESVQVDAVVRNLGSREGTVLVELFDNDPMAGGVLITSQSVTIPAAGSEPISGTFIMRPETILVEAVADGAAAIAELDEANNRARRVIVDRPDLAIGRDNVSLAPPAPLEGDPVAVTVTVRNAGTVEALDVPVEVFDGDPGAGGVSIFSGQIPSIPPAANRALAFDWTAVGGLRTLVVQVDAGGLIEELSEDNNRADRELAVARAGGPDLTISAVDLAGFVQSAITLVASGSVGLDVANLGDSDVTAAFAVRLFEDRDGNGRFDTGDQDLGSTVVSDPVPAAGVVTVNPAIDATLSFYRPLVLAEVDSTGAIPEAREDNNRTPLFGDCEQVPAASFVPVEEWYLPGLEVESTPAVVQLSDDNGDGAIDGRDTPDVVFHTEDGGGRAITARSGDDGRELWTFRSSAANPLASRLAHVAAADLDGDGISEIVGVQSNSRLLALDHRGRLRWVSDPVEGTGGTWAGGAAVGDLDGDGTPEIALGRVVLSHTGELIAVGTANVGRNRNFYGPFGVPFLINAPLSVIADVDLDGRAELVAGDAVYRLSGGALTVVWDQTVPDRLMEDGYAAVGNLDADPEAEIVYVSSNQIMVLNHDGSVAAGRRTITPFTPFGAPTFWAGPPTLADLTGDGVPEILVAAHRELVAFSANLSTLWRKSTSDQSEQSPAIGFDLDGDGAAEVLYADESTFRILEGATGATLHSQPNISKTATEYPVVADVDGDGAAEILVGSDRGFNGDTSTQGLHVLGHPSWRPTRPIWNEHSYHVTNVQLDGTVPADEAPSWNLVTSYRSNQELPVEPRRLANLTVSVPRTAPATAEGVPVTLRVGNGGLATVPPGAEVGLYEGDPATFPQVGLGATTGALRPGQWEDVVVLWQAPGSGLRPAVAVVDPLAAIDECDETDNRLDFQITEQLLSDLSIPADGVTVAGPVVAGQIVPVRVRVDNAGAARASSFVVRVFDGAPALGAVLGEVTAADLEVGGSTVVEIPWSSIGFAGSHTIHALVDPDDLIPEQNEANNSGLAVVDVVPATLPDLSLEAFSVIPAVVDPGVPATLRAEVLNRGAGLPGGFETAFLLNGAEAERIASPLPLAAGETRLVEVALATLNLTGVVAVEARLDPSDLVAEVNESNNDGAATLEVGAATLTLAVTTDSQSYAGGDTVAIELTAENLAAGDRDLVLEVEIADASLAVVELVHQDAVTLAPGANPFAFAWSTGANPPGAYRVVARLLDGGAVPAAATAPFSISADVGVEATLLADRASYAPLQTVLLAATVRNNSANQSQIDLRATLSIREPGGAEVFNTQETIATLVPAASQTLDVGWPIANSPPGAYTAVLTVEDSAANFLTSAVAGFTVEDSSETGAGLSGELAVTPSTIGVGAPLLFDVSITNGGNADMPALRVRVDLVRAVDGVVAASVGLPLPLDRDATASRSVGYPTTGLAEGDYVASLIAVLGASEKSLDSAPFTAVRAVSVADAAVAEGDAGTSDLNFTLSLSSPSDQVVTVDFATADATATAGADYQAAAGSAIFSVGETSRTVPVTVFGDTQPEPDEVLLFELSTPSGAALGDSQALGTIADEEGCASGNLLINPGAELGSFEDPVPGWTEALGAGWRQRFAAPAPLGGAAAFGFEGAEAVAELRQEVDVGVYAALIDLGGQEFVFDGFVRSAAEALPDGARLIVEYRDAANAVVLDAYDSGELASVDAWQAASDIRAAPVGTRWIRVRLLATRNSGSGADAFFDRLGLRSVGTPILAISDSSAAEGDAGPATMTFDVSLSCPSPSTVDVDFATTDGTATAGSDYVAGAGTVSLAPGEVVAPIAVELVGDLTDEPAESLFVDITTAAAVVLLDARGAGTIVDDDEPETLSISDVAVTEGDPEAVLTVILSAASGQTVTVAYATTDGSAVAGDDYQQTSGLLTFQPGQVSQPIAVPLLDDGINEPAETFGVTLGDPVNATLGTGSATITVTDDDTVEIAVSDAAVEEGDSGTLDAVFVVSLSVPSTQTVAVDYATADVEAVAPDDYMTTAGTLSFPAGVISAPVAVPVVGDLTVEQLETFRLLLANPTLGVIVDGEGVGSILDNDAIRIEIGDVVVREVDDGSASASLDVTLSRASTAILTVDFATLDGSAVAVDDYVATSDTLSIPIGATGGTITVPLAGDLIEEGIETFTVELSNPSEGVVFDAEGEVTVVDDDGWVLNGEGSDTILPGCIYLTSATGNGRGSAWRPETLDLTESFDKTFRVLLGFGGTSGGGMAFVLQTAGTAALGTTMGYAGISPSAVIEVDIENNGGGDITQDHLALHENGAPSPPIAGPVPALASGANLTDGVERDLRVVWNAPRQELDVHFDGDERLVVQRDLVATALGGATDVTWGLTGSDAFRDNVHYFCEVDACRAAGEVPAVNVGDVTVTEGDAGIVTADFPVTLSCPSDQTVTVDVEAVDQTATAGEDFVPIVQTLTFLPGETSKSFIVEVTGDVDGEPTEIFEVVGSNHSNAKSGYAGLGTIIADDVSLVVPDTELAETDYAIRKLVRLELEAPLTTATSIDYTTIAGTATGGGVDYDDTSGTVTFNPGQTARDIILILRGDTIVEGDETLTLELSYPSGAPLVTLQETVTLVDDDDCPSPNLLVNGSASAPGVPDGVFGWTEVSGFAWTRSGGGWDGDGFFSAGRSALAELRQDVDLSSFAELIDAGMQRFEYTSVTMSYPQSPADPSRVILEYRDGPGGAVLDAYDSGEIAYTGTSWVLVEDLRTPPPGTRSARVRLISRRRAGANNDGYHDAVLLRALRRPSFAVDDVTVTEGSSGAQPATFTVSLSCPSPQVTSVDYLTVDGTARAGVDYAPAVGTLVFQPGETAQTVSVSVFGDTLNEGDEEFELALLNPVNASLAQLAGRATIVDDESVLSITGGSVVEGHEGETGSITFNVTLTPALDQVVTVDYATADDTATAGADYVATSGTLTLQPGETAGTITVEVIGDDDVEPNESFFVDLSNPNNASIASAQATGTIIQDDLFVSVLPASHVERDIGTTSSRVRVVLTGPSTQTVTVNYFSEAGTATVGVDYDDVAGTLSFSPGQVERSIPVSIHGDTELEPSETFLMRLESPVGARLGPAEATVYVLDDDDCPSQELLANPGAEEPLAGAEIPGWTEVIGSSWTAWQSPSTSYEGLRYFFARSVSFAELSQDVDVSGFATRIDLGIQRFLFMGHLRSGDNPPDLPRIVLEYRDATNTTVLDGLDTGEVDARNVWYEIADLRPAPPGTRWIRVRMIARRQLGSSNNGIFDGFSLRTLGTPVFTITDDRVLEGDVGTVGMSFDVGIQCAFDQPVSVDYQSVDVTATAGADYEPVSGTLTFQPGETQKTIDVTVLRETLSEDDETFEIALSNPVTSGLVDTEGVGLILDDDGGLADAGGPYTTPEGTLFALDASASDPGAGTIVAYAWDLDDDGAFDDGTGVGPSWSFADEGTYLVAVRVTDDAANVDVDWSFVTVTNLPAVVDAGLDETVFEGQVLELSSTFTDAGVLDLHTATVDWGDGSPLGTGVVTESGGAGTVDAKHAWDENGIYTAEVCVTDNAGDTGCDSLVVTVENAPPAVNDATGLDLRDWVTEHYDHITNQSRGIYEINAEGTEARQIINGRPSVLVGDLQAFGVGLKSALRVETSSDDDYVGFVLGYRPGDSVNTDANFLLLDWKRYNQGSAKRGMAISRITGPTPDNWSHATSDSMEEIARAINLGDAGFFDGPRYDFEFEFGATHLKVWVEGNLEFDLQGDFQNGRIGFYNYSMERTRYYAFSLPDLVTDEGADFGPPIFFVDDGVLDTHTATVDWGDGSPVGPSPVESDAGNGRLTGTHAYPDDGAYSIEFCVTDDEGASDCGTFPVTVNNVAPAVEAGPDLTVFVGDTLAFDQATFVDPGVLDVHTATIDWGDGSPVEPGAVDETGGSGAVSGTHAYAAVGGYTLEVCVTDDELDTGCDSLTVSVELPPPALAAAKIDTLFTDNDGNGQASPGDELLYQISIANTGGSAAIGVVLTDPIPAQTAVVPGSVQTTAGTVDSEDPVQVTVGTVTEGATVDVSFRVAILGPLPTGFDELTNQGSVASNELADLPTDDPDLPGAADPTLTPVVPQGVPELTAEKVDALAADNDGDGQPSPGDEIRYDLSITNGGSGAATGLVLTDLIPAYTAVVAGSVTTSQGSVDSEDPVQVSLGDLAPAATATVVFRVTIDSPVPSGVTEVVNQGTVTSVELPAVLTDDPALGGDADPTETMIVAAPSLAAEKSDALAVDADGDTVPSPGDTLEYTVTLRNNGNTSATAVTFGDPIPAHTAVVPGSVTVSQGSVDSEDPVGVTVGEIAGGGESVEITFRVTIDNPVPAGVMEVVNQGVASSAELADVATDDPDVGGDADPTVTAIAAEPELLVEKTDVLFTDGDGDGVATPADVLLYQIAIENTGNTPATGVVLSDGVPPNTSIEPGSVQTSQGTVVSEDPVEIDLGAIGANATATVSFRVVIDDPFPFDSLEVANQAIVASNELPQVLSDDPDTPAADDPTSTEVFIFPEVAVVGTTETEADAAASGLVFLLTLSEPSNRYIGIEYETEDQTAVAGLDYVAKSGDVAFLPGEVSVPVTVAGLDDSLDEVDETMAMKIVDLDGEERTRGVGTILDDDAPPALAIDDVTVAEGDGGAVQAVFTVSLSAPSSFAISVDYATSDGTATAGADYTAAAGTVVIPAGAVSGTLVADVLGDLLDEPDETFSVDLSNPVNAVLADAQGLGTILDDDEAPPELEAAKTDALFADNDGDAQPSPGDELLYDILITNVGGTVATGVTLGDLIPVHTSVVAGSVTTDLGTVVSEDPIEVAVGELGASQAAAISFRVLIDDPVPAGVTEVVNQGTVTSVELPVVLTDDPALGGAADPTVTMIVAAPDLVAEKSDALAVDADGDTVPSPGDTLEYTVTLVNNGNTSATAVAFGDPIPAHTAVVPGSVTTTQGTITSEDPVGVTVGEIAGGGASVEITFRVTIDTPVPAGVTEVVNQGVASSAELADVPTDDPDAGGAADPTVTMVTAAPSLAVEKTDVLFTDADGDGVASPGDTLLYTVEVDNVGNTSATAVVLSDPIPAATSVEPGSVQTSQGTVVSEDPVEVELGEIGGGGSATVTFRVAIADPFPAGSLEVANQATVASAELPAEPSDDPDTPAPGDPTATPVFVTPEIAVGDATATEADAAASGMSFAVTLSVPSNREVRVDYATVDQTALAGLDYQSAAGTVIFAPGETERPIVVTGLDDPLDELDETYLIELANPVDSTLADAQGVGTILDDDAPPALSIDDVTVAEGDAGSTQALFTVMLSAPSSFEVAVDYATADGTAAAGIDYSAAAGTVVIPAGATSTTLTVDVLGDVEDEPDETFFVDLSNAANAAIADARGLGTIVDDDEPPVLEAAKTDALSADNDGDTVPSPGDELLYEIVISNSGGSAASGVIFTDLVPADTTVVAGSVTTTQGTVTSEDPVAVDVGVIPLGATAAISFRVVIDDPVPAGVMEVVNQGTVTSAELPAVLTDDPALGGDADPTETMIVAAPDLVAEKSDALAVDADGDAVPSPGDTLEYTVTLRNNGNTSATAVAFGDPIPAHTAVVPGSVTTSQGSVDGEDPVAVTVGEIAGGGASVTVSFRVTIDSPLPAGVADVVNQGVASSAELADVPTDDPDVGGAADPTVTMVTAAPVLAVEKTDVLFTDADGDGVASPGDTLLYSLEVENAGNTSATAVVLSDPIPAATAIEPGSVQTSQGTVLGEDPVEVELGEIGGGGSATVSFRVAIADPFPAGSLEVANQATVASAELPNELSDDPDTPAPGDPTATPVFVTPEIAIGDATATEADASASGMSFAVTLSVPSNREVRVDYATVDQTALAGLDYQPASGTVIFAPGETGRPIVVTGLDDPLDELDETYLIELANPVDSTLADAQGVGTILDDDAPPAVAIDDAAVAEGDSGAVQAVFTVSLSAPSSFEVSVDFATADGTATAGVDYTAAAGTAVIPAGTTSTTLAVAVLGDELDEPDETYVVDLVNPVNAILADAQGLGTILDDDEVEITIDDVTVDEGDTGTTDAVFTVTLSSPPSSDLTVDFATVEGTATADEDYTSAAGTLTIPAGATAGTIVVSVLGDPVLEPDESFSVELSGPSAGTLVDGVGQGTILDDELCEGPNLLDNPGAEELLSSGELPGWTEILGTDWQPRFADPPPSEGEAYFFAGEADLAELAQDVDLGPYAAFIAAGGQAFVFAGAVRTFDELPADTARIVVEYRDTTNTVVLDVFDSGEINSVDAWQAVEDLRLAPVGTGWVRVRLLTARLSTGPTADGYFDALSLRSLRTPVLSIGDAMVTEGDAGTVPALFGVTLSCATVNEVSAVWATAPGTASEDVDYGSVPPTPLVLPAGTTTVSLPVEVFGDTEEEPDEIFFVDLSDPVDAVVVAPRATGFIVDDDGAFFCPRSPGYWKNHVEQWPVTELVIGGVVYDQAELLAFLRAGGRDASLTLARQLVATRLNLESGSDPVIQPIVDAAEAFLVVHPPGSDPRGADKTEALALKNELDDYNNQPCEDDDDSDSDSDSDDDSDSDSETGSDSDSESDSHDDSDSESHSPDDSDSD